MENKGIYKTFEFKSWADRKGLSIEEEYLITRYLDVSGRTLEAGTGGGRILLALKERGFSSLYGFDYISEFIEHARGRDQSNSIRFDIQDASSLEYQDAFFDQVIYLQQIISSIEDEHLRMQALTEAYRVLMDDGTAIFSVLNYEVRKRDPLYWPLFIYLGILRMVRSSRLSLQYFPWLRLSGRLNIKSMYDRGPYVYWYKVAEVDLLLTSVGFRIVGIGSSYQLKKGRLCASSATLLKEPMNGMLYVVAKK